VNIVKFLIILLGNITLPSDYMCLFSRDNNNRIYNYTESLVCRTRRESRYGWKLCQICLTWQQKESGGSCHSTRLAGKLVADWREMRTQPTAAFFGFSHFSGDCRGGEQTFTPWHLAQVSNYYLNRRGKMKLIALNLRPFSLSY